MDKIEKFLDEEIRPELRKHMEIYLLRSMMRKTGNWF